MNHYFEFKQFTIQQDQCAQKVSETACILGAWTKLPTETKSVLDIGSGTGLLSLMLAQRYPLIDIDAIEINTACFKQLQENIHTSIFSQQIHPICKDIRHHENQKQYDFIIVNPPFHEAHLKSQHTNKNLAWHSNDLSLLELIHAIKRLLNPQGQFSILLPYYRLDEIDALCKSIELYPAKRLLIRHSEKHPFKFFTTLFTHKQIEIRTTEFSTKNENIYSTEMINLMTPYYKKL